MPYYKNTDAYRDGSALSNPMQGEDIVITGISGCFPGADNITTLTKKLYQKIDVLSDDKCRWEHKHPEMPKYSGKLSHLDQFDNGFFGLHPNQSDVCDPMVRLLLEKSIEAIMDSGTNPKELEGTLTGVYVANSYVESDQHWFFDCLQSEAITGCTKSMIPNRLSYFLKLNGPSCSMDSACSSSLYSLENAYRAIRDGTCDRALVCGVNLILNPYLTLQFSRLGVLSPDGVCKSFDANANGFVRSEAIVALFLQKSKEARRVYSKILHVKTNSDGYKEHGINHPSKISHQKLLEQTYLDIGIDPGMVDYLETHGTGTKVGDPVELAAINQVFCRNRQVPFLIGSIKSNIGHTEATSGLSGVIKAILIFETGLLPANLHFIEPKKTSIALINGRCQVVTNTIPIGSKPLIGVNNFGFGGSNGHVVLNCNLKTKIDGNDNLPRLVCVSARTKSGLKTLFNGLKYDVEYIGLFHKIFAQNIDGFYYRGFTIITKIDKFVKYPEKYYGTKGPIYMILGTNNSDWSKIGEILLNISSLKKFVEKLNQILLAKSLSVRQILKTNGIIVRYIVYLLFDELLKILNVPIINTLDLNVLDLFGQYSNGTISLEKMIKFLLQINENRTERSTTVKKRFVEKAIDQNRTIFDEYLKKVQKHSIILQIGQNFEIPKNDYVNLTLGLKDFFMNFLGVLGSLYQNGYNILLDRLYPELKYPVGRSTPIISSLIEWNHSKQWTVVQYPLELTGTSRYDQNYYIDLNDSEWQFLKGHIVDGQNLISASTYIKLICDSFNQDQVIFENVKFKKAVYFTQYSRILIQTNIDHSSGTFELYHGTKLVVDGKISRLSTTFIPPNPKVEFGDLPLNTDDIYKELKLRGYEYTNEFKGISKISTTLEVAKVAWTGNWCTFLDLLLQLKVFQMDTRHLYIPTGISLLKIDKKKHLECVESNGKILTAHYYKNTNMIKCGGVEIYGIQMVPVSKKKSAKSMILESYKFVPNTTILTFYESLRINLQIIMENCSETKLKCLEIINTGQKAFGTTLKEVAETLPKLLLEIVYENTNNSDNFHLICGTNLSVIPDIFEQLKPNGFILSWENNNLCSNLNYLTIHEISNQKLCLFHKNGSMTTRWRSIDISDGFNWFESCQNSLNNNLLLYTQNEPINGILGFYNCLKLEPNMKVCCFILDGTAPQFDLSSNFYQKQLKKNMNVNIYQNGTWGTYRHLLLTDLSKTIHSNNYAYLKNRGDLSTFEWYQAPMNDTDKMIQVHYSAINFKDIMTATNRISPSMLLPNRLVENLYEGLEYSGIMGTDRIMGIVPYGGLTNHLKPDDWMLWKVPSGWSLEDAATIPVVYATVLYALKIVVSLKPNQSILIHSGSGGVGQAAIRIALHQGCHVYTTVGNDAKREFLIRTFPQLSATSIGYSHDNNFHHWLFRQTNGCGVDCIVNSLAGHEQLMSIQSLGVGGSFLEIGKVDLIHNESLKIALLKKQASFHGVMLDQVFLNKPEIKKQIFELIQNGLENGNVVPLPKTIFCQADICNAFKYMTKKKHIGKVLLKMDNNLKTKAQFHCKPDSCYIIIGGLGGFGLELADWLVLKGAKYLILTTTNGLKTGYQNYRINIWKSYGINVQVLKLDASKYLECQKILEESSRFVMVDGIFNLAGILNDHLFTNQTLDNFKKSFNCKVGTTRNLDILSRKMCPNLRYFVVFSSICCGRGNRGQTNYAMANSFIEKICEERQKIDLSGMAIQWGLMSDVGMMESVDKDKDICGSTAQKPENYTKILEELLVRLEPIVSCFVLAEKVENSTKFDNPLDIITRILGTNLKTVSFFSTFPELGMDSLTSFEISQALEKEYQIYLTIDDLKHMTLDKLQQLQQKKYKIGLDEHKSLKYINKFIDNEPNKMLVLLKNGTNRKFKTYCLPGTDGSLKTFEPLINELDYQIYGFHYPKNIQKLTDIIDQLMVLLSDISIKVPINFIAHSSGTIIALELASRLEINGYQVKIICLDGSPLMVSTIFEKVYKSDTHNEFETKIICVVLSQYALLGSIWNHKKTIMGIQCNTFKDRLNFVQNLVAKKMPKVAKILPTLLVPIYKYIKAMLEHNQGYQQIKSKVYLFKAEMISVNNLPDDYGLGTICSNLVHYGTWPGNHFTIMENIMITDKISMILSNK